MKRAAPPFVMERVGRIRDLDRSFDIAYWQRLGSSAIFAAAWQIVVEAYQRNQNSDAELRLRRTAESFQRLRR